MSYTLNLQDEQAKTIILKYNNYAIQHTNNYTLFRAKYNTSTITIFKTLTMLIQGKDEYKVYKEICEYLNIVPDSENSSTSNINIEINALQSIIGTDEVGTGDFFGSIIVAGAYVTKANIAILKKLGVKDSKEINDYKILELAPFIMSKIPYTTFKLDSQHYNFLVQKKKLNMNHIKALMHNTVINNLKQKVSDYDQIIIDGFTTRNNYFNYLKNETKVAKDVILEEKAENKHVSVACASIIARYVFLKDMESLSDSIGFELPKGAGKPVDNAILKIYNERGTPIFRDIAKTNFKNFDKYRDK